MSGIVGIVCRDGSSVDPSSLDILLRDIDHRGPDDAGWLSRGPCGIGQQRSITTPEAAHEATPESTDEYLLTADARIDNRSELVGQLDVEADPVVTDADLILAAYDEWGHYCPKHLVGAYAFAIWDSSAQQLYCARDHAGVKPFYYVTTEETFAFASELHPLLDCGFASTDLDEVAIADYLVGSCHDTTQTIYRDIRRLAPAHWAVIDTDSLETGQYWSLDGPTIELGSEEAYLSEFERRFEAAVRTRLRTPSNTGIGSLLSGGLDSSSITCTAARLSDGPFPTFSLGFDDIPAADEGEFIDAVRESFDLDSHVVHGETLSPMGPLDAMLDRVAAPFVANNAYLHWALYRAADDAGTSVLLDGFGGDQTVSHGTSRLSELVLDARPLTFTRELATHASRFDLSLHEALFRYVAIPLAPDPVRHAWRRCFSTSDPLERRSSVVDEAFAQRLDLRTRVATLFSPRQPTARADHRRVAPGGLEAHNCEIADTFAASYGIEPRYPFFDRRLMEFCFRVPSDLKFRDGWRRWILRNALSDRLPDRVRNRTTKGNLGTAFYQTLRNKNGDALRETVDSEPFPPWLDQSAVHAHVEQFLDGDDSNALANVWRPAVLCRWYERRDR
ncbi:asparagine synthase-related protein [Halosimplex amylolyticum]|uniref:asparagine synthase-related protein n=1 Tax=Halosimplex amylolyticum TaxID=3396616 RepID=UPI003F5781A1